MRATVWCLIMRTIQMLLLLIIGVLVASGAGYCPRGEVQNMPDGSLDCQILDVTMWSSGKDPVGNNISKTAGQYVILVLAIIKFFEAGAMMWVRMSRGNSWKRLELFYGVGSIVVMIILTVVEGWYGAGFGTLKNTIIIAWIAAAVTSFVAAFAYGIDIFFLLKAAHTETRQATVRYYT